MNWASVLVTAMIFSFLAFTIFNVRACSDLESRQQTIINRQNNAAGYALANRGCVQWQTYPSGVVCNRWRGEP